MPSHRELHLRVGRALGFDLERRPPQPTVAAVLLPAFHPEVGLWLAAGASGGVLEVSCATRSLCAHFNAVAHMPGFQTLTSWVRPAIGRDCSLHSPAEVEPVFSSARALAPPTPDQRLALDGMQVGLFCWVADGPAREADLWFPSDARSAAGQVVKQLTSLAAANVRSWVAQEALRAVARYG